ncbi:hypothetical protein BK666_20740 [Pseudomonas frederiksbergensis]|uniref:Uncharacterized protein n=1 Tax=Pseudomonas frederiksbergensis TaxID=104087 RepID=A0A423JZU7_9PSED|nr:hypothetical protein [Pseudomonas frederiksbergensis]RON43502.1 hypothetical protein BK666_20740 [Pseudomonas frederiksbergensis]
MQKRGKSVGRKGSFKIYEVLDVDDKIIGFCIVGPGSDGSVIFDTIDEAIDEATRLSVDYDDSYQP